MGMNSFEVETSGTSEPGLLFEAEEEVGVIVRRFAVPDFMDEAPESERIVVGQGWEPGNESFIV